MLYLQNQKISLFIVWKWHLMNFFTVMFSQMKEVILQLFWLGNISTPSTGSQFKVPNAVETYNYYLSGCHSPLQPITRGQKFFWSTVGQTKKFRC
jgi:hypothetical protein